MGRIKRIGLLLALLAAALGLGGCGYDVSVEDLFTLPRMAEGYTDLAQQLDGLLNQGYEYASPTGGRNIQSVQMVDLDGDGREELIANVMAGDGVRSACVYQRRSDGVYLGTHSADGFPDFYDWGINASWSEYDPAEDCFRLHYCVAPEEYAEITYRGMEGLTFEPYTDPYAVDQALWLKTGA